MPDTDPPSARSLDDMIADAQQQPVLPRAGEVGRPTKYTPALGAQIALAIKNGATRKDAARLNGVSYKTFYNWLGEGADDHESEFFNFYMLIEQAEAELMTMMAQVVIKAALTDPKYALEVLKRRRRSDWGDSIDVTKLSADQIADLLNSEGEEEA